MAKKTTVVKKDEKKTNVPAKVKSAELSTDMLSLMEQDSGKGVSTAAEDNIVPLIYILQANSPQLDRSDAEKFIKGAKAGDIWFRGTKDVVDGEEEGITVIPAHFSKCWIEWRPNRGGFVGRHADRPKDAVQVPDEKKPEKLVWRRENGKGNIVVETREHVVVVCRDGHKPTAYVVPMSSSNHTASRSWMGLMNNVLIPGTDKTAPSYGYKYKMRTVPKKNDDGSWYAWFVDHAGGDEDGSEPLLVDDMEQYKMARKINDDFNKGILKADVDQGYDDESSGTSSDHDDDI